MSNNDQLKDLLERLQNHNTKMVKELLERRKDNDSTRSNVSDWQRLIKRLRNNGVSGMITRHLENSSELKNRLRKLFDKCMEIPRMLGDFHFHLLLETLL